VNLGILIVADLAGKSCLKQELVQLASSLSVDVMHFFDAWPMDFKSTVENQEITRNRDYCEGPRQAFGRGLIDEVWRSEYQ
jgi:hypothetical protein